MTILSNEDQEMINKLHVTLQQNTLVASVLVSFSSFLTYNHNGPMWIHWDISFATNTNLQEIVKYITKGKQNFTPSKCPWLLQIWVSERFQYIYSSMLGILFYSIITWSATKEGGIRLRTNFLQHIFPLDESKSEQTKTCLWWALCGRTYYNLGRGDSSSRGLYFLC